MPEDNKTFFNKHKFKLNYFNNPQFRRKLRKKQKYFNKANQIFFISGILLTAICIISFIYLSNTLPSLEQLENPKPELATEVYSADGVLLTKFFLKNRTLIRGEDISPDVINALIATEDADYFSHWGFNLGSFLRAMFENIVKFRTHWHGASTITQQLAKNLYLTPKRSIVRKIREFLTAILIERTYTKKEILSLYLNTVYFGQGAYGIEAAAWTFFSKPAKELTVTESATLIANLRSPTRYDPINKPENALKRRNLILNLMAQHNFISDIEKQSYLEEPISLNFTPITDKGIAPYFTEHIRQNLQEEASVRNLNIYEDGLIVQTSLDTRMQAYADAAVKKQLKFLQATFDKTWSWHSQSNQQLRDTLIKETPYYQQLVKKSNNPSATLKKITQNKSLVDSLLKAKTVVQAAFVVIDPQSGHIKAWVGGKDFEKYKFDHVRLARRQPGSTFKPFAYLTALNEGIPPNFSMLNQPIAIPTEQRMWIPKNATKNDVGGETTLREALRRSLNYITVRLSLNYAKPSKIAKIAKLAGITTPLTADLALPLGASVVSPLEMASAYATFANRGMYTRPTTIISIRDKFENELITYSKKSEPRIEPDVNHVLLSMLRDVVDKGTGVALRSRYNFRYDAAGKTGTTQGQADAWFVGCTPQLSAAAWTGFDDSRVKFTSMHYGQGSRAALPIWAEFMVNAYKDNSLSLKPLFFREPKNIYKVFISKKTNKPIYPGLDDGYYEYFTKKMVESNPELKKHIEQMAQKGVSTNHAAPDPLQKSLNSSTEETPISPEGSF